MTAKQKIQLRLSEIRKRLSEIAGAEGDLTDEQTAEITQLRTEYQDAETRAQALMVAEGGEGGEETTETGADAEGRAYAALLEQSDLAEVFSAALEHRATSGATAELQQHHGLSSGNTIPLAMLAPDLELRTAGVTPAPGEVGQMQRPIIPAVFPRAAVSFLNIQQDRVDVGDAVYTVLSTSAAPGRPAEGVEQAHSTAAFAAQVLVPARLQASIFFTREDRARLAGMDSALRQNLSDALADELDEVVLDDLLTGNTLAANAAGAADSYASYRKRFVYDRIDGTYAAEANELKLIVGSTTYSAMAASYRAPASDMNALGAIMVETGGIRVSAHAPAASNANKQNGVVRLGMRQDYAIGLWEGVQIIPDEITMASTGEILLTSVMLYAKKLLRAGGFAKVEAQHS